jgi:hypothetical protein
LIALQSDKNFCSVGSGFLGNFVNESFEVIGKLADFICGEWAIELTAQLLKGFGNIRELFCAMPPKLLL